MVAWVFLLWSLILFAAPVVAQQEPGSAGPLDRAPTDAELTAEEAEFGTAEAPPPGSESTEVESEPDFSSVEEIMIRSQRREQREEDATASVVAFSAVEIEAQRIMDLRDVSAVTPNLEIKSPFAASNPTLFIRGVGLNDFNANSASAVAVYNDDIYMNSPAGQLGQIFDLQTIDVLRGPQGTLYGRNASAGVIRLVSRKPQMGEYEANVRGSYGTLNTGDFEGGLTIPMVPDVLAWRGAFTAVRRDGYVENLCAGYSEPQFNGAVLDSTPPGAPGVPTATSTPIVCPTKTGTGAFLPEVADQIPANLPRWSNNRHNWAGRSTLRLLLDSSEWILNVHGGQNDSLATQFKHVGTVAGWGTRDRYFYEDPTDSVYKGQYNFQGSEVVTLVGGYLQGEVELPSDLTLLTVTGYDRNERGVGQDYDAGPLSVAQGIQSSQTYQVTQELRVASDYDGPFQWQSGVFFLYEDLESNQTFVTEHATFTFLQSYDQTTWAASGFVHFTLELADTVTLDAGIRYNWERKDVATEAGQFLTKTPGEPQLTVDLSESKDFSGFSGNLTLNWQMADEISSYMKYSRGFKGGHFNGATATLRGVKPPANPEKVDAFEVGIKGSWWENRFMAAAAAFYYDYKDLQVFQFQNTGISAPPDYVLINANNARVSGVEAEIEVRPLDDLTIRGAFGYLNSKYLDFQDTIFLRGTSNNGRVTFETEWVQDYTGNTLVASPDFSVSGTVTYFLRLGRYGSLEPRYDFSYKGGIFFDPTEGRGVRDAFPEYAIGQAPYTLHNLRLAWRSPNELVEVAGWVRNVGNVQYKNDVFDLTQSFGLALQIWSEPRTAGVTVSVAY